MVREGTLKRQRSMLAEKLLPKLDALPLEVWTPALIGELGRILQAKLPDHVKVDIRQVG